MKIIYDIYHPGERAAGIIGFSDTVSITVESGDPGGDTDGEDSFKEFMLRSLREWYDGANVKIHVPQCEICGENFATEEKARNHERDLHDL